MMPQPLVISVILNTNRRADTLECLESLHRSTYRNQKVIVLDNHSTDGSVSAICESFPNVHIIELTENLGYAGNNNVGIEAALREGADWVLVLNEDIVMHESCVEALVALGQSDEKIGVVGPLVYHHNEPDYIQTAGGMLRTNWDTWHIEQNQKDCGQVSAPRTVDIISGCALMVRRDVVKSVGAIDARFFYYKEETEWCFRIRQDGWQIVMTPQAKIWHKGVQREYRPNPSLMYYKTRNWFLFLMKHKAPARVWMGAWYQFLRTVISWSIRPKWHSKREYRDAMVRGMFDFLRRRWGKMPL
jgi:GT2 family glycosyltransferase